MVSGHRFSVRVASRIYGLAARLLPSDFRAEYGAELESCFVGIAAEARRRRGVWAVASVTLRSVVDLVTRAPREHLAAARAGALVPGAGWGGTWQDVRHAMRRLARRPSFTLASVVTLALGIAAAASVFSLVYGVVLSPLPYPDSERIVEVDHGGPGAGVDRGLGITYGFFRFYAERLRGVEAIAMYSSLEQTLTGVEEPVRLEGVRATPSLGDVLRTPPGLGRWFTSAEGEPGAPLTVVLSDRLWREQFGADPGAVGRTVELGGVAREVIGVMPASFAFPSAGTQFWIPREVPTTGVGGWNELSVARLREGVGATALQAEIRSLYPALRESTDDPGTVTEFLDDARVYPIVRPLKEAMVGDIRASLWILLGTVGFVLLIAVANVANLFLVRAEEHHRETAVRSAVGASRARITRGYLAETLLVAAAAAALGLAVAGVGVGVLRRYAPVNVPRLDEVDLDPLVITVALGTALVTAVLLGLIPALRRGGDLGEALKEGGRRTTPGRVRVRGRSALVAIQVALALTLLIESGLLFRTFRELRSVDLGFSARDALVFEVGLPTSRYGTRADAIAFQRALLSRLRGLAGVESAAAIGRCLPLSGNMCWGETLEAEGRPPRPGEVPPVTGVRVASSDYFTTMGIPVRGRPFTMADGEGGGPVAILSEDAAAAYFPDDDAVGRRIRFGSEAPWHTVIGVAGNVRGRVETEDILQRVIYVPMQAELAEGPPPTFMVYVLRTGLPPTSLLPQVRGAVAQLDPGVPVAAPRTMRQLVGDATAPATFALVLVGLAGVIALLLGTVGVYAVVAFTVSQRAAEIGIRMALGARATDVRRMVVAQGGLVVLVGVAIGLITARALSTLMEGMLYGVSPSDPASYLALTLMMLLVAGLALYLPAHRASRVDPLDALRAE